MPEFTVPGTASKPFRKVGFLSFRPTVSSRCPGSQSDEGTGRAAANHGPVALSFERSELTKHSRDEIDMNAEIRAIFLGLVFAALSWAAILALLYEP